MRQAFADAETAIESHAAADPECAGMGTTLIVGLLRGDALTLAHAGDVRGDRLHAGTKPRVLGSFRATGIASLVGFAMNAACRRTSETSN